MKNVVTFTPKPSTGSDAENHSGGAEIVALPVAAPPLNIKYGFRLSVSDLTALETIVTRIRSEHGDLSSNAETFLDSIAARVAKAKVIVTLKQAHWLTVLADDADCRWIEGEAFLEAFRQQAAGGR
ncbi:hypothetical protein M8994_14385 [Brucella sp. 21LCYQ03]|nr:hypothetical protein [Brucella sp. 21LCYQ03]